MREEKCTWRVEVAKLLKSIGQDDLAVEHLEAVVKDIPTAKLTTVDAKEFEESVSAMMKELKERIALRDSLGQKLQENMESNTTRIALAAVGLAAIAGMVYMVKSRRNRSWRALDTNKYYYILFTLFYEHHINWRIYQNNSY